MTINIKRIKLNKRKSALKFRIIAITSILFS